MRGAAARGGTLPEMRQLAAAAALGLFASIALSAVADPSRAATRGAIQGRVVSGATGEPQPGVRVTLSGGRAGGRPIVRESRTDPKGRYRFAGLPTGDEYFYAIDARYQGGLFAGGALTLPDDTAQPPVIDSTLRVWPTTSDPNSILFRRNDLFLLPSEGGLAVIESVRALNTSELAYIGRADNESNRVSLGFALSSDAQRRGLRIVDSTLDVPELVPTDFGFGTTIAIPPGETQISFAYTVAGSAGTSELSRPSLYPIIDLSIFAGEGIRIESNRLEEKEEVTVGGKVYREYSTTDALDAGDPLQAVAITETTGGFPLMVGTLGLLGFVGMIGVAAFYASRRTRRNKPSRSRAALISEIAALDLRHEAGELSEEEWRARRDALKGELERGATDAH
ncbi:MAG TPA: carboxypeptidase-like regulatory domain-containing protein [Actinomycetota bacterium]|nr:carboxypeptidase-like regulatory domain-containing protein [Actinomycetota bacterium]